MTTVQARDGDLSRSIKSARRDQTRREIQRLLDALAAWEERWEKLDQYASQLSAVCAEVRGAAAVISSQISSLGAGDSTGSVFAGCSRCDRQIAWLWRVFGFFRDKFNQRGDPEFGATVAAADEVVWSCYKPFFRKTLSSRRPPAPLPFIAPEYSPAAVRRDQTPESLIETNSEFEPLRNWFRNLPIPILKLPPSTVTAPWSMILVGHEIGHFIQPLVQPDFAFVAEFRQRVEDAVTAAGGTVEEAACWGGWAPEIFADWYSVVTMGPWAVWMMAQLELDEPTRMLTRRAEYPSPLARMALLGALADALVAGSGTALLIELGLDIADLLRLHPEDADLTQVAPIAKSITAPLPDGIGRLDEILFFRAANYSAGGEVDLWAKALVADPEPTAKMDIRAARLATAGCGKACWQAMKIADEKRRQKHEKNLGRTAGVIAACAEPGKRAAVAAPSPRSSPGTELAALLGDLDAATDRHAPALSR